MKFSTFIIKKLEGQYGQVKTSLFYNTVFELLIAVSMSAQTNDNQVNKVTPDLFNKFKTIKSLADANVLDIEQEINSINYYKSKARNIKLCATRILNEFNGEVPSNMDDLISLAGVGRKTANVVLNEYFGDFQGIVVDTHVRRLSNKLGLSDHADVVKIEQDLIKQFDKKDWEKISLLLIYHGRAVCDAKKANCGMCVLKKRCKTFNLI